MSKHHRAQKWTSRTGKFREQLTATLPTGCIECGGLVTPADKWHVAHRVPAALGGRPTRSNVGVAHAACNVRAGAKLGARVVNSRRRREQDIRPW